MRGYFPEPSKSILVVKPAMVEQAKVRFDHLGFKVVTGTRYLSGFIGTTANELSHIQQKVSEWSTGITHLSNITCSSPQIAFTTFQQSYQRKWQYLHLVVLDCADHFAPVETAIYTIFLPALLGGATTTTTPTDLRTLLSLLLKLTAVGVPNLANSTDKNLTTSIMCTSVFTDSVLDGTSLVISEHQATILKGRGAV